MLFSNLSRSPFTGNNLTVPSVSYPITSGVWTWFTDPRAVRYNGKTYFGFIDNLGNIKIASFADGEAVDTIYTLHATLQVDDHDNPGILIRDSDKKIMAFYSRHDNTDSYLRISSSAEDVSAFASEVNLAAQFGGTKYTYMNPIQLLGETNDPIYVWYRDRDASNYGVWSYSKSEDGGATWSARTEVVTNTAFNGTYLRITSNGSDRIDFIASPHPDNGAHTVHHFYYTGGNFYQSDGTQIVDALPFQATAGTLIYDSDPDLCWIHDIQRNNANGNIAVVFVHFVSTSDHRYYYALWNGSTWSVNEIVAGGGYLYAAQSHYSGGIVIDPTDLNTVVLSKFVNGNPEIWKYVTADGGSSWVGTPITQNSRQYNARPVFIRNGGVRNIMWWEGQYNSYTDYKTQIRAGTTP